MPPQIAILVFSLGILGLFLLDRDREAKPSIALWIPVIWIGIASSRNVSEWLQHSSGMASSGQYLEGNPIDRNVQILLLLGALIVLVWRAGRVGAILRANSAILLFFFYCALSILWSDFPDVAFKRWTRAIGDILMVLVVLTDPEPLAAFKRLVMRITAVLLPLSILFYRYLPDLGRSYGDDPTGVYRPVYTGVTTNKNTLGMTCLVLGLGSLWRFLEWFRSEPNSRKKGQLIAQTALLAMVVWVLVMSHSATSLGCFILGGGIMVVTSLPALTRRPVVIHLIVISILVTAFSATFLDIGSSLLGTLGRDSSLTGRTVLWGQLYGMVVNPMIGTGFESFWLGPRLAKMWAIWFWHPVEAHNGYLEVYLNLGWTGIFLLAVLMFASYRHAFAVFRRNPYVGRLGLAYFITAVTYNFTEAAFKTMAPVWIFFLLATIAVPVVTQEKSPEISKVGGGFRPAMNTEVAGHLVVSKAP